MVGEEEVTYTSEYNDLQESKGELVPLKSKGNFEWPPHLRAMPEKLPWWAYILMLPFALPGIVLFGWVIETMAEMVQ